MTRRKKLFLKIFTAVGALALAWLISLLVAEPTPRVFYSPWDLENAEYERVSVIRREYAEKRRANAAWTRNPFEVGVWMSRGGNSDGCAAEIECSDPTKVKVYRSDENHATVIVLADPLVGDDSVAGVEDRIDLRRAADDGAWEVEWGGSRWHCHEGRGGLFYWSRFELCS
ncbi:MAG TPA: hypothetical protein VF721_09340 [Pyrinomonadaceae bacterium]